MLNKKEIQHIYWRTGKECYKTNKYSSSHKDGETAKLEQGLFAAVEIPVSALK